MAERLKDKLLDSDKMVDLVCGPDAYRSIPHLLSISETTRQGVANVMLSADETYADIVPMRIAPDSFSAHLSIMRGCNNMCSFCVVPFTRGNERSRAVDSILQEVKQLSDQGIKEVTLLGQNVNSYRDTSEDGVQLAAGVGAELSNPGFNTIYKRKDGGMRFTELLDKVSLVDPEVRANRLDPVVISERVMCQMKALLTLMFFNTCTLYRCASDSRHLIQRISPPPSFT